MPTLATIRAAIKAKMLTVADIGQVHDYERYARRDADFAALFLTGAQIRGWVVRRVSRSESAPFNGREVVRNRWRVSGYMALDDSAATEKTFDDLVEALIAAFKADQELGGIVHTLIDDENDRIGLQLDESTPVLFAGVLCHSARLSLVTMHYE